MASKHTPSYHTHPHITNPEAHRTHFVTMFIKSSLITLALVLSATATPLVGGVGTPIAFQKRNALTTEDGRFNHLRAAQQVVHDRK